MIISRELNSFSYQLTDNPAQNQSANVLLADATAKRRRLEIRDSQENILIYLLMHLNLPNLDS